MSKVMSYVARYGPLVAAFALGVQAVLPASGGAIAAQVVSILSLFGVAPDQAVVGSISAVIAGGLALFGVARKLISLVAAYWVSKP